MVAIGGVPQSSGCPCDDSWPAGRLGRTESAQSFAHRTTCTRSPLACRGAALRLATASDGGGWAALRVGSRGTATSRAGGSVPQPTIPGWAGRSYRQSTSFTRQDYRRYRRRVHRCLDVFAQMLDHFEFDEDRPMTGVELEICLVDRRLPAGHAQPGGARRCERVDLPGGAGSVQSRGQHAAAADQRRRPAGLRGVSAAQAQRRGGEGGHASASAWS